VRERKIHAIEKVLYLVCLLYSEFKSTKCFKVNYYVSAVTPFAPEMKSCFQCDHFPG